MGLQIGLVLVACCAAGYAVQVAGAGRLNSMVFPALFVLAASGLLLLLSLGQTWNRYSLAALHPAEKLTFIFSWDGPAVFLSLLTVLGGAGQ